ncbi:NADPH-dependent FMN reductase [Bdellovibrio bacteriovorus]|uniref:NADPH-dependent FMN reductase n=1 Tax=Bdellovibrio bacteriovorus TaxID=959 RepID=A0A150WMK2_BDEBC|nr:flavodoxin family protein [Bdellovibrio bacteriovorus]KYG65537.1 NADPH-dependent FMN reductase [Bdellovibrio bacteriovorus]
MTKKRTGQPSTKLDRENFMQVFRQNFFDPTFDSVAAEISAVAEIAWQNYQDKHKAPITRKAGTGFKDPNYDLSVEWIATSEKLKQAALEQRTSKDRILVINASPRNEHTCPSEVPKSFRLTERALQTLKAQTNIEVDFLDLSLLTAEYGKKIYPCKACVSTSMPLCHWPCSCYPNNSLNQVNDWMAEIYERWVRAHGVMIVTPVHWYQAPSGLKLMMDRLVCADGGNPDPTSTHGKKADEARKMELEGWDYPKHLKNRAFGLYVHGDYAGAETLRRNLADWLEDMGLIAAQGQGIKDRYIGYMQPYATNHEDLDKDQDVFKEIDNVVFSLLEKVSEIRNHPEFITKHEAIQDPRPK